MNYNDILMHHYSGSDFLCHHGIKGQKWGVRRFQNPDGSLTAAGRERYGVGSGRDKAVDKRQNGKDILDAFKKDRDAYGLVTGDTKNLDSLPVMQKLNQMIDKDVQTYEESYDSMIQMRSDAYDTPDYDKYVIKAADYDYDNSPYGNVEFESEKDSKDINYWVLRLAETKYEAKKKKNKG